MKSLTGMLLAITCVFFLASCGKVAGDLQKIDPAKPQPVPPEPLPKATPGDIKAGKNLFQNLLNNAATCNGDLVEAQVLDAFDKGRASCTSGTAFVPPTITGSQCNVYISQAAASLGVLACRGAYDADQVRSWLKSLIDWNKHKNDPPVNSTPVAGATKTGLSVVFFSALENSHIVGGRECPTTTTFAGGFADCGMGNCYGNQTMCQLPNTIDRAAPTAASLPVILDVVVTAENTHVVGGPGCPAGYTAYGSGADCGMGNCYGNQAFCSKSKPSNQLQNGERFVKDVKMTAENAHVVGSPGCPAGYEVKGSIADCGMGNCYGNQALCVLYDKF